MALLTNRDLEHLPVVTESGDAIGAVVSWDIETETQSIVRYHVKPAGIVQLLSSETLLIAASAVVRLTKEHLVVRDTISREPVKRRRRFDMVKPPIPALTRATDES